MNYLVVKLTIEVLGKIKGLAALPVLLPLGRGDVLDTLGDLLKHIMLVSDQANR